jgi:hypothetical protein
VNIKEIFKRPDIARQILGAQSLNEEGQTYFTQVLTEYRLEVRSQNPTPEEQQVRAIADAIGQKPSEQRTWGDLFSLEIAVVKLQDEDCLRRAAWAVRAKYKDLVGEKTYDAYQTSNPPDPKTAAVNQLRCDTLQILSEFHWSYAFAPLREKIRNDLMRQVFFITSALVVVALAIAALGYFAGLGYLDGTKAISTNGVKIPALPVVIAMGMIGGYISLQQRIQNVPSTGDPIVSIAQLSNSQFSLYLVPVSGAVFAVLLYVIFIGGLLSGPLFPKIYTVKCPAVETNSTVTKQDGSGVSRAGPDNSEPKEENLLASAPNTGTDNTTPNIQANKDREVATGTQRGDASCKSIEFKSFVTETGPESGISFAMLLAWSFIAGFAERFVPDTIDRLISQAQKK